MSGKIQFTAITGTGTAGSSSSPISISFNFAPTVAILVGFNQYNTVYLDQRSITQRGLPVSSLTTSFQEAYAFTKGSGIRTNAKKSSDGKTVYWYVNYGGSTADDYCNDSSTIYYFMALA